MKSVVDLVMAAYESRPCWLCGHIGCCPHREFDVELAFVVAEQNREERVRRIAA
jgi:hypothetical protein